MPQEGATDMIWDKGPLTEAIARRLQQMIRSGELKPGQKLPSQRLLAGQLNVSRPSLREASVVADHSPTSAGTRYCANNGKSARHSGLPSCTLSYQKPRTTGSSMSKEPVVHCGANAPTSARAPPAC